MSATAVRESQDRQRGEENENEERESDHEYYTSPPGLSPTSSTSWENNNYQTLEITITNPDNEYNSLDLDKAPSSTSLDCHRQGQDRINTESKIYWNERFYQPLMSSTRDSASVYNTTEA